MKTLILNYNQIFLYFSSNKCSLGEQNILFFQKHWKNVLNQNFWKAEYITFRFLTVNNYTIPIYFNFDTHINNNKPLS